LNGVDALYATVQMPPGIPVATVAIGDMGAKNAAILAVQMLSLADLDLREKLRAYRGQLDKAVAEKDAKLQASL
jgi:phosphoribosylaminoimidazole carboxylase PurE protein